MGLQLGMLERMMTALISRPVERRVGAGLEVKMQAVELLSHVGVAKIMVECTNLYTMEGVELR